MGVWWRLALLLIAVQPVARVLIAQSPPAAYRDNWSVRALDGRLVPMASLRGRVVFLHVWATWCAQCRPELRTIARLRATLAERGLGDAVAFVLVSPESERQVTRWMGSDVLADAVYVEADRIPAELQVLALPTTHVIGRDGVIAHSARGASRWDDPRMLRLLTALATAGEARP